MKTTMNHVFISKPVYEIDKLKTDIVMGCLWVQNVNTTYIKYSTRLRFLQL